MRRKTEDTKPILQPDGLTAHVPLTGGMYAVIDAADMEAVSAHRWYWRRPGRGRLSSYCYMLEPRRDRRGHRKVLLHRFLLGDAATGLEVHHINGDGLLNTRENLQPLTPREHRHATRAMRKPSADTPYLYVTRARQTYADGAVRWRASVSYRGDAGAMVTVFAGDHIDARFAAMVGDLAARWVYGDTAPRNFADTSVEAEAAWAYHLASHLSPKANMHSRFRGVTLSSPRARGRVRYHVAQLVVTKGDHVRMQASTELEAAWLYDAMAVHFRGEDAKRNFPGEPIPAWASARLAVALDRREDQGKWAA